MDDWCARAHGLRLGIVARGGLSVAGGGSADGTARASSRWCRLKTWLPVLALVDLMMRSVMDGSDREVGGAVRRGFLTGGARSCRLSSHEARAAVEAKFPSAVVAAISFIGRDGGWVKALGGFEDRDRHSAWRAGRRS